MTAWFLHPPCIHLRMRRAVAFVAILLLAGCARPSGVESRDDAYATAIAWTVRFVDAWNGTTALAGARAAGYDANASDGRVVGWRGMAGISIEDGASSIVASFIYSEKERTRDLWTKWRATFEEDLAALQAETRWTRSGEPTWELHGA